MVTSCGLDMWVLQEVIRELSGGLDVYPGMDAGVESSKTHFKLPD